MTLDSKTKILVSLLTIAGVSLLLYWQQPTPQPATAQHQPVDPAPVIQAQDWDQLLKKHKVVCITFCLEDCPPCEKIAPLIDQLAFEYSSKDVFVGKIYQENAVALCKKLQIIRFPTTLIFRNGELKIKASGVLSLAYWHQQMKELCTPKPAPAPLLQAQDLAPTLANHKIVVLGVLMKGCGPCERTKPKLDALYRHYQTQSPIAIRTIDKAQAGAIISQYQIKQYPTVLIFKNGELVQTIAESSKEVEDYCQAIDPHLADG